MKLANPFFLKSIDIGNALNTYGVQSKAALRIVEDEIFGSATVPSTAGYMKYWNGSVWTLKPVKHWTGSAWVQKPVKFWNGSSWVNS